MVHQDSFGAEEDESDTSENCITEICVLRSVGVQTSFNNSESIDGGTPKGAAVAPTERRNASTSYDWASTPPREAFRTKAKATWSTKDEEQLVHRTWNIYTSNEIVD